MQTRALAKRKAKSFPLFLLSAVLSYGIVRLINMSVNWTLQTNTTIVGHPVYANYNIDKLFFSYYNHLFVIPPLTLAIFAGLRKILKHTQPLPDLCFFLESSPAPLLQSPRVLRWVKTFSVGFSIGLCFWKIFPSLSSSLLENGAFYGVLYSLCNGGVSLVFARLFQWKPGKISSVLNCLFAGLLPGSLYFLSLRTSVMEDSGLVLPYPWFPLPLLLLIIVSLYSYLFFQIRSKKSENTLGAFETQFVVCLCVSLVLFLSLAKFPETITRRGDYFHYGETVAPAQLMLRGLFPWRDLVFIHGLLEDPFKSLLGMKVFSPTAWGAEAGVELLFVPFFFVCAFLFLQSLFYSDLLWLGIVTLLLPSVFPDYFGERLYFQRFLFVPLIYLSLGALLKRASFPKALIFSVLLLSQAILSPEAAYLVVSCAILMPVFEIYQAKHVKLSFGVFRRSFTCFFIGLVFLLSFFFYLHSHQALFPFFKYLTALGSDHRYTGGIPVQMQKDILILSQVPIVFITLAIWYYFDRFRRKKLSHTDWVILLVTLHNIFYYQKFLNRADGHVYHSYATGLPLFFYGAWIFLRWADSKTTPLWAKLKIPAPLRHRFWTLLLAVSLLHVSDYGALFLLRINSLPRRLQHTPVHPNTLHPELGYLNIIEREETKRTAYEGLFSSYMKKGDPFFDFTNQPLMFHFLMDLLPASRFYNVSLALHQSAQEFLINDLEKSKPALVAYHSKDFGIGPWDGIPTQVRHYAISSYLLKHYLPLKTVEGVLFFVRTELYPKNKPIDRNDYFFIEDCNWRYVPFQWRKRAVSGTRSTLSFSTGRKGDGFVTEITIPSHVKTKVRFLEIAFEDLKADKFNIVERLAEANLPGHSIRFETVESERDTYRIPVASCSQWYGYAESRLFLLHSQNQTLRSISLIE